MANHSDDIVKELPVYLSDLQLNLLQYPTRIHSDMLVEEKAALKLKNDALEVQFKIPKNLHYDESTDMTTIKFKSQVAPNMLNHYCLVVGEGVYLHPIHTVWQMRPDLNMEDLKISEDQSRRRFAAYHYRQEIKEKPVALQIERGLAYKLKEVSQAPLSVPNESILDILDTKQVVQKDPLDVVLARAQILPFPLLFQWFQRDSHQLLLDELKAISFEVHGHFIIKSHLINAPPQRDVIIKMLANNEPIHRQSLGMQLSSDSWLSLLKPLCSLQDGYWYLKYPHNSDFAVQFPEFHQAQLEFISALNGRS